MRILADVEQIGEFDMEYTSMLAHILKTYCEVQYVFKISIFVWISNLIIKLFNLQH